MSYLLSGSLFGRRDESWRGIIYFWLVWQVWWNANILIRLTRWLECYWKMAVSKIDWSQVQIQSSCYVAWELERKPSQKKHTKLLKGEPVWYSTIFGGKRTPTKLNQALFSYLHRKLPVCLQLWSFLGMDSEFFMFFPLLKGKQRRKTLSHK